MKEYGVENQPLGQKYKNSCISWYRRKHLSEMDKQPFTEAKPPRDFEERVAMTKAQLLKQSQYLGTNLQTVGTSLGQNLNSVAGNLGPNIQSGAGSLGKNLSVFGSQIKEGGMSAGTVVAERASTLKTTVTSKEFGQKIFSLFGKKGAARPESAASSTNADEKEPSDTEAPQEANEDAKEKELE